MKTDITLLLDRSGSMQSVASDVPGALNAFVQKQVESGENTRFTLIQFDSVDPCEVTVDAKRVEKVKKFTDFSPRGCTPLLYAIGNAIKKTRKRMKEEPKPERPQVLFVIYTDGYENDSGRFEPYFDKPAIKKLIGKAREKWGWQFMFMGADIDAMAEAQSMGIARASSVTLTKGATGQAVMDAGDKAALYARTCDADSLAYTRAERAELGGGMFSVNKDTTTTADDDVKESSTTGG